MEYVPPSAQLLQRWYPIAVQGATNRINFFIRTPLKRPPPILAVDGNPKPRFNLGISSVEPFLGRVGEFHDGRQILDIDAEIHGKAPNGCIFIGLHIDQLVEPGIRRSDKGVLVRAKPIRSQTGTDTLADFFRTFCLEESAFMQSEWLLLEVAEASVGIGL